MTYPCTLRVGVTVHSGCIVPEFRPGDVSVKFWNEPVQFWTGQPLRRRRQSSKSGAVEVPDPDLDYVIPDGGGGDGADVDDADVDDCAEDEDAFAEALDDIMGDLDYEGGEGFELHGEVDLFFLFSKSKHKRIVCLYLGC